MRLTRRDGSLIAEYDVATIREAVEQALKGGVGCKGAEAVNRPTARSTRRQDEKARVLPSR